jgi:hypothetical protein
MNADFRYYLDKGEDVNSALEYALLDSIDDLFPQKEYWPIEWDIIAASMVN